MKSHVFFCLFLLMISVAAAQDLADYESLWLKVNLNNTLQITHSSEDYSIQDVTAILAWYPRENSFTQIQFITSEPKADFMSDGLRFRWEYPTQDNLSLSWVSQVNNSRQFKQVYGRVSFPLIKLDPGLGEYLLPEEIIDSSPEISELATRLTEGETDLYQVVFKLAEWVREHVSYNLTTLTADASQKASWVLENREGVCDEITSLFIALLRSVGIPARFVAGLSYTNLPGPDKSWGPHGWAEVFFPGYGWVPFDVTYGEYGWLDAGHIKLDDSLDARKSTVTYTVRGKDVNLVSKGVDWNVQVLEQGRLTRDVMDLKFSPYAEKVNFGSHNLLTLEVQNLENYYVASKFHLYQTEGTEVLGERLRMELFGPREKKKLYWMVRVKENLKTDFEYAFPFRVDSTWGGARNIGFKAKAGEANLPSGLFMSLVQVEEATMKKPYSQIVDFACSPDKDRSRLGETITVYCGLSNHGDVVLKSVRLCLEEDCQLINVGVGSTEQLTFVKTFDSSLASVLVIRAENADISKAAYVRVNVIAEPKLNLTLLEAPAIMEFNDIKTVKFMLGKESKEMPKNLTIRVSYAFGESKWVMDELSQPFEFDLKIYGSKLDFENDFLVKVEFKDDFGEPHLAEKKFQVKLVNLNIPQKVQVYSAEFAFWLDRFFKKIF
ncbi:MAG TPA: transglutaminase-like domain-containing protein [Candidatus Nanoarchaeia archaeon]|nr:transglutaminase-like domain-containing protein [Candidatus Nanoarchaeia archaeon]